MRHIARLLELTHAGRTVREIAAELHRAPSTVVKYQRRAARAGLAWPLPDGMTDATVEAMLFAQEATTGAGCPDPDW